MSDEKTLLVAQTTIRRRTPVPNAVVAPGKRPPTNAEDISVGRTFEADADEAKELIRSGSARRAGLDEQAKHEGGRAKPKVESDGLDDMTVAQLHDVARQRKITLPREANRKDEIIAELRKAPQQA
jgi:hypothetical protein